MSGLPGTLTTMTTSTDAMLARSAAGGGTAAALETAGWLGTMSRHTAGEYQGSSTGLGAAARRRKLGMASGEQ